MAKVGGLADVVHGLSRELDSRGNRVEIILPKYDCMRHDIIADFQPCYNDLLVPWYGGAIHCTVYSGSVNGCACFFIEPHSRENYFNRQTYYGCSDDVMRFAFFSKAALEYLLKSGKRPDIIHCHDWQTGICPVLLYEIYKWHGMGDVRACYTIHNFRYQGVVGGEVLKATGLNRPEYFFRYEQMRDNAKAGALNFMKGGIVYSNFVTTVSPHYAWEAGSGDQGCAMGATLHAHQAKFGGVLNGIDYEEWNPASDPFIPSHFAARTIEKKYQNKESLRERLWLRKEFMPLIAYVGRLDHQKGVHLIKHALHYSVRHGAQFVVLGVASDRGIGGDFWNLKRQINDNPDSHIELSFNDELAHLIYAGADMIFIPSMWEPCGLTQMIALRYGTVPIVRGVGGLADTVFDKDNSDKPAQERNGYVFMHPDARAVESTLQRAISCWYEYPQDFRSIMLNAMKCDYSWTQACRHYLNIYELVRVKKGNTPEIDPEIDAQ